MISADQLLERAAEDGSLDPEEWPRVLESILTRLDEIINQFPKPSISSDPPPPQPSVANTPSKPQETSISSQESQSADKENAPPATPPSRPPVPAFARASSAQVNSEPRTFPADILSFFTSIKTTLSKNFPKSPPHTIQRLAELILHPKARYKHLPPYLRALDRVVSVSSPTTVFPLPQAILPSSTASLLNGAGPVASNTLGSDESLGGALLTPIPWLRSNQNSQSELVSESTEMVDGPNGAGRIETVSVINGGLAPTPSTTSPTSTSNPSFTATATNGASSDTPTLREAGGVTQGELLRQEQEAGVVIGTQTSPTSHRHVHQDLVNGEVVDTVEGEEEHPHARGPEEIGMEDMGPQHTRGGVGARSLDIEAAVGRRAVSPLPPAKVEDEGKEEEMKDAASEE